ncbi:MAG TPA: hypothetical protein VGG66_07780, partial [Rhizomicrobium sp.]
MTNTLPITQGQAARAPAPLAAGSLVYDKADPSRHGKVVRSGTEVSEVRYDDGADRNIPNVHLRGVD